MLQAWLIFRDMKMNVYDLCQSETQFVQGILVIILEIIAWKYIITE